MAIWDLIDVGACWLVVGGYQEIAVHGVAGVGKKGIKLAIPWREFASCWLAKGSPLPNMQKLPMGWIGCCPCCRVVIMEDIPHILLQDQVNLLIGDLPVFLEETMILKDGLDVDPTLIEALGYWWDGRQSSRYE
jgi:hypothetical protein